MTDKSKGLSGLDVSLDSFEDGEFGSGWIGELDGSEFNLASDFRFFAFSRFRINVESGFKQFDDSASSEICLARVSGNTGRLGFLKG